MHRFFADEKGIENGLARLESDDATHALRVLRLRNGDSIQLFSNGDAFSATIEDVSEGVTVRVLNKLKSPEPTLQVTLYQGVPKGDKMEYIVQKCTEAGVKRIVPVNMPRCVARLAADDDKKGARCRRFGREEANQPFRAAVPEIASPVSISVLPDLLSQHELALVPWEEAQNGTLRTLITPDIRNLAIVIGPEGGMSEEDVAPMLAVGAQTITLGPRIFRTETAGLAAIVAAMTLSGNLE